MATTLVPTKRNRGSNWEAEFYRNGYPQEIIVIEDSPPLSPHDPSNRSHYAVVQAPTSPPFVPVISTPLNTRIAHQQPYLTTTTDVHASYHRPLRHQYPQQEQRLSTKRQRLQTPTQQRRQQHQQYETSCYAVNNKRRRKDPLPDILNNSIVPSAPTSTMEPRSSIWERSAQPPVPPLLPPPVMNDSDGHFIVRRGDFLKNRYEMDQVLGQGTYGKVVRCFDHVRKCFCAIKIIRAIPKYREASQTEIRILDTLKRHDQLNFNQCIHLVEWFQHCNHVCMVFELLGQSIYDFLKANDFIPFPLYQIQHFAKQLLNSVAFIHELKMIHTDLKPENILLKDHECSVAAASHTKRGTMRILHKTDIVLIDFGSATFQHGYHSAVVSTRHYRAPEIILGLGWSYPCDMWSLGCILIEFFMGEALFQTHDNLEHLAMMERVLGKIPASLSRQASPDTAKYFRNGRLCYAGNSTHAARREAFNNLRRLRDIVAPQTHATYTLVDLLEKMLTYEPSKRISAREALRHPFLHIDFDKYGREIQES